MAPECMASFGLPPAGRPGRNGHWDQCGGTAFTGTTCCAADADCAVRSPSFSQCVPKKPSAAGAAGLAVASVFVPSRSNPASGLDNGAACTTEPWTQCDGKSYTGDKCCPKGYACTYRTAQFSQCVRQHYMYATSP